MTNACAGEIVFPRLTPPEELVEVKNASVGATVGVQSVREDHRVKGIHVRLEAGVQALHASKVVCVLGLDAEKEEDVRNQAPKIAIQVGAREPVVSQLPNASARNAKESRSSLFQRAFP